jgi:hypothetical protein
MPELQLRLPMPESPLSGAAAMPGMSDLSSMSGMPDMPGMPAACNRGAQIY